MHSTPMLTHCGILHGNHVLVEYCNILILIVKIDFSVPIDMAQTDKCRLNQHFISTEKPQQE